MFKVGDKVRCISNDGYEEQLKLNGSYRIDRINNHKFLILVRPDGLFTGPWTADQFELEAGETKQRQIGDLLYSSETVYTTSDTGGTKGHKVCRYNSIPWEPLAELAAVYGRGAEKYPDEETSPNWMLGMPYSWMLDALGRHIELFRSGQDFDKDDGLHHLAHAAWYLFALQTYQARNIGTDDRQN